MELRTMRKAKNNPPAHGFGHWPLKPFALGANQRKHSTPRGRVLGSIPRDKSQKVKGESTKVNDQSFLIPSGNLKQKGQGAKFFKIPFKCFSPWVVGIALDRAAWLAYSII